MSRKPKPKNTLSAGERVAQAEAEKGKKGAVSARAPQPNGAGEIQIKPEKPIERVKKTKPELPKPQYATVKIDLSTVVGKVKPMHAMCNGPVSYGADISSLFREIGVPYVRFDGTDSAISAYAIDISRIFKDINADPRDGNNYDFSFTDKYMMAAHNTGARVILRLGESVDRFGSDGAASKLPDDLDTYVEACIGVIRHYNYNWHNGFAYGIQYFEIWSTSGSESSEVFNRELELYKRLASSVKLLSEDIKVGGMCFDGSDRHLREFLRFCKRSRAPLDFLTLSSFNSCPHDAVGEIKKAVPLLYDLGFNDTEIIVGAWGYTDSDATGEIPLKSIVSAEGGKYAAERKKLFESQGSVKGAAYALAFMIALGELREVGMACLYDAQPMMSPWCAICDRYGNPNKTFHAFKAYSEIYRAGNMLYTLNDIQEGFAHSGIYAMAAEGNGAKWILISSFDGCGIVDIRLEAIPADVYSAEIYLLDGVKDMTPADSVPISGDKKRLMLNISRYGAAMIKIY